MNSVDCSVRAASSSRRRNLSPVLRPSAHDASLCPLGSRTWRGAGQRVWLQVALAVVAGLGSLVVCSGAVVVIIRLFVASIDFHWIGSSLDPPLFWLGVSAAMLFAGASLSLPPLALGARDWLRHKKTVWLERGHRHRTAVFLMYTSAASVGDIYIRR